MMNDMQDYDCVRKNTGQIAAAIIPSGLLDVTGTDAAKFLHGQITNDVLAQKRRSSVNSCLLNNTGHLLSTLVVHRFDNDKFWIETPLETEETVQNTLNRFIVRERVSIKSISDEYSVVILFGNEIGSQVDESDYGKWSSSLDDEEVSVFNRDDEIIRLHKRYHDSNGMGFIIRKEGMSILQNPEISIMTESILHILRVESGIPAWGAELDESIIPLEAGLDSYISFTKGCYMGQEIIARIKSRGHTNRRLVKLKLNTKLEPGDVLWKDQESQDQNPHLKITSVTNSPDEGWIALGYVRQELVDHKSDFVSKDGVNLAIIDKIIQVN
jgi:folate-binding protein YgfZ